MKSNYTWRFFLKIQILIQHVWMGFVIFLIHVHTLNSKVLKKCFIKVSPHTF